MNRSILTLEIRTEQDVVLARQRTRQLASLFHFDNQDQTRVATALSEIARNALKYGGGAKVEFSLEDAFPQQFLICIRDQGKGIEHLQEIMEGHYISSTGMGLGIIGSKRLVDFFKIDTAADRGTTVLLGKNLPKRDAHLTSQQLGQITEELIRRFPPNPFEELQQQNQELLRALEEVQTQKETLAHLNHQLESSNRELEDTNRGVVALYAELDEKAEYLQRADDIKTSFLSNMTHEFRTPLNSILSLSKLLLDQIDGTLNLEQRKQVSFVQKAAQDLSDLVNDLLDLAKVAAGKVVIRPNEFRANELFAALRGMFKPLLGPHTSVNLIFEEPSDVPLLHTDEGKVSQILRNLISNALKYTEKGEVRVSAKLLDEKTVVFSVADTGIGIAEENQERIFEEFSQIESYLQTQSKGTGLGLPLTRKLAGLLGGRIELKSELDVGSTFYAILPKTYRGPKEVSYIPEADQKRNTGGLPVLVLEDSPESVLICDKTLYESNFQITQVETLNEARQALQSVRPIAIVSDAFLNGENTWHFISELKHHEETRHIPIILAAAIEHERKARAAGVDAFHTKPVSGAWFLEKLREVTRYGSQESILIVDDDDIARYILKGWLGSMKCPILEASNARDGIQIAKDKKPKLIFLDLSMPDINGFEALKILRSTPETSSIPVIINTSKLLTQREAELLNGQVLAIFSKETRQTRGETIASLHNILLKAGLGGLVEFEKPLVRVDPAHIKILNVDDNQATRYMVTKTLRQAGFDVYEAETGKECLRLVNEQPDLIILDIQLPDTTGFEICEKLKKDPNTASIPILHLSATHTTSEDQAHGLEGGADAYLTHPLEPLVLLATINALLRTKQAEQKLKETVEKLQIERHLREQFVATLTHDLRNPLSAAKTSAQMIGRSTIDSSRHPALLGRIIDCINRIDQMISNLLDANRIKAGENLPLEIEPSNLYTLVQETLDELSSIHGDRFVLHSSSTVNGYWSRNGIRRMVDNLATNAIKYGLPTTPVSIRITDRSNSVEIAVHNEGPALNREDQVRMFEPFHRSSSALTSRNKGWGLGLTLVRGIAEGHRGRVHVESEEKIGTTFRVTLPKDCRSLTSQENDKSLIHFHRKG